jgi:glutaredoxin 1
MKAFVTIYGRPGCPYCVHAKDLAEQIEDMECNYINIREKNITMEDLSKMAGKTVNTVPQIFVFGHHLGGYDTFSRMFKK